MELTVGTILEGKVKSITNFGAFVALPDNKTGMVHISEIANAYVNDIHEHLTVGQDVKVVVIASDSAGKVNLSIKRLEPKPHMQSNGRTPFHKEQNAGHNSFHGQNPRSSSRGGNPTPPAAPKTADQLFEEKLKAFMSESDSKISSIRAYSEHRTKSRRR